MSEPGTQASKQNPLQFVSDQLKELYPGLPEIRDAVRYPNENPGLGVDINETVAARYVPREPGENRGSRGFDGDPKRP